MDGENDRSYQIYQKETVGFLFISAKHVPKLFHLPPLTGLMDTKQALLGQAVIQLLQRCQICIFVLMTGLTRVRYFGIFQRVFGQQGHERMGVIVSGFCTFGYSGHVTADAVGKRVDGMGHLLVDYLVAQQALLRPGSFGLILSRRYAQPMNIMAGCASDPFIGVGRKLPAEIMLVMPFAEIIGVSFFKVFTAVACGFKIETQCPARSISHGPFGTLHLGRRATCVARSADLGPESRRKTGRVDDGQPFVKNRCLRQGNMVGTWTVASLAADARF